jgi:hypothetical protein
MNVYYSNHLFRQEKYSFILHLFYLCRIRIRYPGRQAKARSGIRNKHPGSATLLTTIMPCLQCAGNTMLPNVKSFMSLIGYL